MNIQKFSKVVNSYKKCPNCGSGYKETKLSVDVKDEIITISCTCGFLKRVDENNKEISK